MMFVRRIVSLGVVVGSLALLIPERVLAAETAAICNAKFARQSLKADNYEAFCKCEEVTKAFISRVQRDNGFSDVLEYTYESCPLLANILTDTATASLELEDEHERGGDQLAYDPPANDPPANDPPANDPPANDPPANDPPANDPPADDPPADDPPADDPPADDPPADDPPADDGDQVYNGW